MGSRRKILIVGLNYAPEQAGIAPYTAGLARGLAADSDVQVLTTHPHYPQWKVHEGFGGWRTDHVDEHGVHVTRLKHYVPHNPSGKTRVASELSFAARVRSARRVARPDVVIAVSPSLLATRDAVKMAKQWGVPVGVVVQDIYALAMGSVDTMSGEQANRVLDLERQVMQAADGVVTIHDRMAQAVRTTLGVSPHRLRVIRNWSHVAPATIGRVETRERLGWGPADTIVLHAGNMGAKQGLDNVVDAGLLAERREAPVRFVLMGDGGQRARLAEQARGAQRVDFLPPVGNDEFTSVLAAADVLCVNERAGLREMCAPSKLTSYFSTGLPVVAATSPESAAAHDVLSSGAGLVVPPGDPAALLDTALELSGPDGLLMGGNGPDFVDRHLTEKAALDAYRGWIDELLGSNRVPIV